MRRVPLFLAIIVAGAFIPVFAITLMFVLGIGAPLINEITPVVGGIGEATASDITDGTGNAITLLAVGGFFSIPAAILLAALLGGRSSAIADGQDPPRPPGGPPF